MKEHIEHDQLDDSLPSIRNRILAMEDLINTMSNKVQQQDYSTFKQVCEMIKIGDQISEDVSVYRQHICSKEFYNSIRSIKNRFKYIDLVGRFLGGTSVLQTIKEHICNGNTYEQLITKLSAFGIKPTEDTHIHLNMYLTSSVVLTPAIYEFYRMGIAYIRTSINDQSIRKNTIMKDSVNNAEISEWTLITDVGTLECATIATAVREAIKEDERTLLSEFRTIHTPTKFSYNLIRDLRPKDIACNLQHIVTTAQGLMFYRRPNGSIIAIRSTYGNIYLAEEVFDTSDIDKYWETVEYVKLDIELR